MSKGLVWLRNDLRLTDHPVLDHALKKCNEVLFVYVFDDRVWRTQGDNPRMGRFRARFILQALNELKNKIENMLLNTILQNNILRRCSNEGYNICNI